MSLGNGDTDAAASQSKATIKPRGQLVPTFDASFRALRVNSQTFPSYVTSQRLTKS